MSSANRARLEQLNTAPTANSSDHSHSYNMPARTARTTYSPNWGNGNIWAAPIGSGMKSATETNRTHNRPAPLLRPQLSADAQNGENMNETPDEITGSGSLLRSSESEGWSRRWPSMSNISTGFGSGLGSAQGNHAGASPVRQRTNQHTRSSSPYVTPQPSAIGTGASAKSSSGSVLDPTSRSFNVSGAFESFPQTSPRQEGEEPGRRNLNPNSFFVGNGSAAYSGYSSSVASRSGSVPPSRHGNDATVPFGEVPNSAVYSNNLSPFATNRQPHHSRTSTFSNNANVNGNRFSNQAWQTSMGDLSGVVSRMDLGRDVIDYSYSNYWDQSNQAPSPGSINSVPVGPFMNGRHNSVSVDTGVGLMPQYGHHRNQFADRQAYSPTGSDPRRNNDSPMYFNGNTPPVADHNRTLSTNSSRANLNAYSQAVLERKLRGLAEQQQSYQPSPAQSHRGLYNNPYDLNPYGAQSFAGLNTQTPYYQDGRMDFQQAQLGLVNHRAPPRGPASEMSAAGESGRSPLLEEFRLSKGTKKYELRDIYSAVVEFSGDQHGSRFIQQKLETANSDEKAQLFSEILPNALQLMTDVFGNYVIQKFFEHGNQPQKKQLADKMRGHIPELSLQMYGCRVVQKAFEHILVDQQTSLVKELESQVIKCAKDQNGNHVIQKAIQWIPEEKIPFIINAFTNQVQHLSSHTYGCRVIQRALEHCRERVKNNILDELHHSIATLIVDQYGNYVTQHIIEYGRVSDKNKVIAIVTGNLVGFSTQKYASNVVEKSIDYATPEQRQDIVNVVSSTEERGDATAQRLMRDQYGNYIIQKLIKQLQDPNVALPGEYERFVEMLKPYLQRLKQYSYGKQIGTIERMITSGPPSTLTTAQPSQASQPSQPPSAPPASGHRPPQLDITSAPTPPLITEDTQSPQSSSQPSTSHSTVDEPLSETSADAPRKASATQVEIADDVTITRAPASTPKAAET